MGPARVRPFREVPTWPAGQKIDFPDEFCALAPRAPHCGPVVRRSPGELTPVSEGPFWHIRTPATVSQAKTRPEVPLPAMTDPGVA